MVRRILSVMCSLTLLTLFGSSCGSRSVEPPVPPAAPGISLGTKAKSLGALPKDGVQPWEKLDAAGYVLPPAGTRGASALQPGSNFTPGVERFLEGGGVTNLDEASHLAPAGGTLAYASYRIPLGAQQPGTVTVDANLAAQTEYYVALSDYAADRWEWHGPFTDAQITLSVAHGDYTSSLGNTFVAVAAFDSGSLDVVGIGVTPVAAGDSTAPPAPAAPTAVGTAGGIELTWTPVIAADLAGYRIYYSYSPIPAASASGVQSVAYLEDSTRFVLPRQSIRSTYVALAAVDHSGNTSALSPVVTVRPSAGNAPALSVLTSIVSGERGATATLTASGADSYDFDLDGDGVFDVTGSASGTATIDTSAPGIIRPRVRGSSAGGSAVALGSVSLIITGNQRPVAYIRSQDGISGGAAPLLINLSGDHSTDFDGTITEYAWDPQGDGIFEFATADDPTLSLTLGDPGTYNIRLRVTDNEGAWDVDTFTVNAVKGTLRMLYNPSVDVGDSGYAFGQYDGWETVTKVDWDLNSDGVADAETGPTETEFFKCDKPGLIVVNAAVFK